MFTDGTQTVMTYQIAARQIAAVNALFLPARIQFTLAPEDFEVRRDDYLSLDHDPPASGLDLSDRTRKPPITGESEHKEAFVQVGKERPDRVTLVVHRGSEWRWSEKAQRWAFTPGFSHGFGIRPDGSGVIRIGSTRPRVWTHELGHALGLGHTSRDGVNAPSLLTTEAEISQACLDYLNAGGDVQHPEYAIDNDYRFGVRDTPPDPGIRFWRNSTLQTCTITIRLPGREPYPLLVSRDNLMAAVPDSSTGGFTSDQIAVMRRKAEAWKARVDRLRKRARP